jgi:hypothetical protein
LLLCHEEAVPIGTVAPQTLVIKDLQQSFLKQGKKRDRLVLAGSLSVICDVKNRCFLDVHQCQRVGTKWF